MRTVILGFVLAIIATTLVSPQKVEATHSWGGYHWARTSNPFTIKLGDNLTTKWDPYLSTTSADWSKSSVMDTTIVTGLTNGTKGRNTPKTCSPTAGRGEICNAKYGGTGWLGIASVWVSGDHITQGTVKMNDTYFDTNSYNKPEWRNLVMCQEVGHIFGLDHQDEIFNNTNLGTCMDYTDDPSGFIKGQLDNEHPNQHDYDMLASLYSHLDAITTINQTKALLNQEIDHENRSTWGKELHISEDKRVSVYERDFGNGNKAFTFVTWAK